VDEQFPAPVYRETVLATNFTDAQQHLLDPLLEIHEAHTLMLARQGILSSEDALLLLRALDSLDVESIRRAVYDGSVEDLFFYIEKLLADSAGLDIAGKMHTARSRNDIAITLYRMKVRQRLLRTSEAVLEVQRVLLETAAGHIATIMPAHTHTQPAQPTTLAHYMIAAVEFLDRDLLRLQAAFATVNRCPMGACAITTTGFPIDRDEVARLLGFEGLQVNSYGAIAAIDYATEAAAAIGVAMVNLGKLIQDMLLWCTQEFGYLRLSDAYVQTSSIMPQKRNPVALEHARILASRAFAESQAVLTTAHNTPFGDINDSEDDLLPLVVLMFEDACRSLRLFAGAMSGAEFNIPLLKRRAGALFLTVTELADTLVREGGLSFREAHHLVSGAVKASGDDDSHERIVDHLLASGRISLDRETLLLALDPEHFIARRQITGGPAREPVELQISDAHAAMRSAHKWLQGKWDVLSKAGELRREARVSFAPPLIG
jgi:argininosuccinate lyase